MRREPNLNTNELYGLINEIVDDILQEDPIDVTGLPVELEPAKLMCVSQILEMAQQLDDASHRELMLLATASKLALENFVLHIKVQMLGY